MSPMSLSLAGVWSVVVLIIVTIIVTIYVTLVTILGESMVVVPMIATFTLLLLSAQSQVIISLLSFFIVVTSTILNPDIFRCILQRVKARFSKRHKVFLTF